MLHGASTINCDKRVLFSLSLLSRILDIARNRKTKLWPTISFFQLCCGGYLTALNDGWGNLLDKHKDLREYQGTWNRTGWNSLDKRHAKRTIRQEGQNCFSITNITRICFNHNVLIVDSTTIVNDTRHEILASLKILSIIEKLSTNKVFENKHIIDIPILDTIQKELKSL